MQRERITRTDIEAFGTTAGYLGCNEIRSGERAQAHSDPYHVRIEERLKTTPEGAERPDRRSEVLNEALAKEVEKNVRRREEIRSTTGELAVPKELKDMPIPPDSDPRRRRAMKAATVAASSGSSQMEGSRSVAEAPTQQNSMVNESSMDDEGEEGDEFRPDDELRHKTPLEENKSVEKKVAVTTQESSDGIREKTMKIASFHELGQEDGQVQGEPRMTGTRKSMRL